MKTATTQWLTVRAAAERLSVTPSALRRSLEHQARRASDGGVEADIDGVKVRKFGRLWRVRLSESWN